VLLLGDVETLSGRGGGKRLETIIQKHGFDEGEGIWFIINDQDLFCHDRLVEWDLGQDVRAFPSTSSYHYHNFFFFKPKIAIFPWALWSLREG